MIYDEGGYEDEYEKRSNDIDEEPLVVIEPYMLEGLKGP